MRSQTIQKRAEKEQKQRRITKITQKTMLKVNLFGFVTQNAKCNKKANRNTSLCISFRSKMREKSHWVAYVMNISDDFWSTSTDENRTGPSQIETEKTMSENNKNEHQMKKKCKQRIKTEKRNSERVQMNTGTKK